MHAPCALFPGARLMGPEMYTGMSALQEPTGVIARGMALHKVRGRGGGGGGAVGSWWLGGWVAAQALRCTRWVGGCVHNCYSAQQLDGCFVGWLRPWCCGTAKGAASGNWGRVVGMGWWWTSGPGRSLSFVGGLVVSACNNGAPCRRPCPAPALCATTPLGRPAVGVPVKPVTSAIWVEPGTETEPCR